MKNLILTLAFISSAFCSNAQIELKIRPLGLLFGNYGAIVEYKLSERKSIDFEASILSSGVRFSNVSVSTRGFSTNATYRSYFASSKKRSGGFWGPYANFTKSELKGTVPNVSNTNTTDEVYSKSTTLGAGALIGYKWGFNNNVTTELLFGLGFNVLNNYQDLLNNRPKTSISNLSNMARFAIGYSFGNDKK